MSATSVFEFICLCGEKIRSPKRETVCPKCGRILVTEWGLPQ
jgi:hypothetical protein